MDSRRITTRSFSGNGRSITGDDLNGSSRPGGCSYLSNVRPENRSTLCSVIAQLTEETQPSFETTLKSRAISENCNVKFSCVVTGHPTPQVIWYKDDVQLDRYCGLPKYEIFRNGQTHSLHIYNCTVEDAAIYQASASNSKGIVSCSGVLEVGEMNEFKIHQRYFGKIKQKAEHRRREAEGKENLEPLRTISPERTQRKRRSTMEDFLSMPSSMEDEGNEGSSHNVAVETDTRLQDVAVNNVEEKLLPIANAPTSAVTNGVVHDNANKNGANIHDSAQKVLTAHQPKTPSVKKKIKISSSAKAAKADTPGERASEERSLKVGNSASVALTCTESAQSRGKSEELMEVENSVSASVVESNSRNMTKQCQKSATVETTLRNRPSKEENVCVAPSQKEQLTAPPAVSPAALTSTRRTVSGTEGKQAARHEKRVGHKVTEDKVDIRNHGPYSVTPQPKSSTLPTTLKEDVTKTEDVAVIDVDEKPDSSTGGSLLHLDSAEMPYESRTALPQRPCEQAGDQLSQKEISQKNVSVSRPARPGEFAQARTKNDAPVSLELPYNWRMIDTQQPQKTPSASDITRDDTETLSLNSGLYAPIDKTTQDTWHHSRGSSESYTVLFADLQKSPLESPDGGNVLPTALNTQVDTAVKSVDGTEIQVDEKLESIEVGKLLAQDDRMAPNEKTVEMETESPALQNVELNKEKGTEKCETISKMAEESSFELQNVKPDKLEPAMPHLTNNLESTNELEQIIDFKEISKPVSKVISIAELLRAQLKTLDSTLGNSVPIIPIQADFVQEPSTTGTDTCQELKENGRKCDTQGKKAMPDRKMETMTDDAPPTNIKVTLMEIYHQLNTDSSTEQVQTQGPSSSPVQALQEPRVISPVTVPEATVLHSCDTKYSESVLDVGKEAEASTPVPLIDYPVVSLTEREKVGLNFHPLTSKDELTVCPTKPSRQTSNIVLEHVKDEPVQLKDVEFVQKLMPEIKLNGKTERVVTEMNSTTHLDQYKVEEHNAKSCSVHSGQKLPTESVKDNHQLLQQDSSMIEELSANPTPEASPSFRKRNCASPIPSATPQELASGARRKIVIPKAKPEEATEATSPAENQSQKTLSSKLSTSPVNLSTSPGLSRRSPLLQPPGEQTSPVERRSPLFSRRKTALETQAPNQQPTEEVHTPKTEGKPAEKNKHDPFKAPQVIRKIRSETFADTLGHLKVWCQFFNVLSDSTVKWYKNEEEVAQIKRNAGDETQVNLAIVQASSKDSGVYRCSITNEYGTDSTDLLLSTEILAGMSLREDLGVGEEIEMTPLIFTKGVADSGVWGNRLFGRIMMQESHIGDGCSHKVWRAKVIYGLEPVFESGNTCIIKVRNPITYGGKGESCLIDRNLEPVKQECKIQNLAREYCKIFSAEARAIENFGPCLEVIPVYLMYRPANTIPYSTVEADLTGVYQKYSSLDHTGRIDTRTGSVVEQKCCTLQHWIFQWTNGNLLLTRLEGVDTKITNVGISVKSTGHQALSVEGNPKVFEQFVAQHQCNYFCGLLGLRSLKVMDSLSTPVKPKASRSPLLQRKMAAGSSSPQTGRKAAGSPRVPRKAEQEGRKTPTKQKATDAPKNT